MKVLIAVVLMAAACGCLKNPTYELGRESFQHGLPATANPYQGEFGGDQSRRWLRGWLDAKIESESK